MNFYKNVTEHKGKLLVRGVRDNKEFKEKINFCPTLYSVSQQQEKFKNLHLLAMYSTLLSNSLQVK